MRGALRTSAVLGVLTAFLVLLSGCFTRPGKHGDVHWGYTGETGPAHWGDLSPEFVLAKTGKRQSPVDAFR